MIPRPAADGAAPPSESPAAPQPAVRLRALRKRFGRVQAVRGVDLDVQRGELFGLIGADGVGKSTLIKSVAGVLAHDDGQIDVLGQRIDSERSAERVKARLGLMPQGLGQNLYRELSVDENIDFFARLRLVAPRDLAQRKEELLRVTRLDQFRTRPMKQLSGGMKQKLGLICTLIHQPELLLLDEPTTGVDPVSRRDFWAILTQYVREQATTALVSTAYLDEAAYFDRLALMQAGQIIACGPEAELTRLVPGTVVELETSDVLGAVHRLRERFPQTEIVGGEPRAFLEGATEDDAPRLARAALGDTPFENLHVTQPELEDVVVALLRRQSAHADERHDAAGRPPAETRADRQVAIAADGLVRDFDGFRAVDHVSLSVRAGELFGLLGANGAGKTTVIKMLTGLLAPTAGHGTVAGAEMLTARAVLKERIGYVSQVFSLYPDLRADENIELYAGIYGLTRRQTRERLAWVIEMADLGEFVGAMTKSLPVGIRQRLALGCALVHRPPVLFLDEPTSGVDALGRWRFWSILTRLAREEGTAVLVTTHYMSEAEHCDRLALMHAGRIVVDGAPRELREALERNVGRTLDLVADRPLDALRIVRAAGFASAALFGRGIHVRSLDAKADAQRLRERLAAGGVRLLSANERRATMEDVFVHRVRELEDARIARQNAAAAAGPADAGSSA